MAQSVNSQSTNYTLDVAGGLPEVILAGSTRYLQVGGQLLAQTSAGNWHYILPDHLGSVRQLTDGAGDVILGQDYDPFGNPLAAYGAGASAFGYTGEQADESGLLFLRARYYDAGTGRFVSQDPFPGMLESPYSQHPYQYGYSNPVRFTDPSGEIPCGAYCQGERISQNPHSYYFPDRELYYHGLTSEYADQVHAQTKAELRQYGATGLDFIPLIGDAKGLIEVGTGHDLVTGEALGHWRWLGLVGMSELRHLRHTDEMVDLCADATRAVENLTELRPAAQSAAQTAVLIVGESHTLEYSINLALRKPDWQIITSAYHGFSPNSLGTDLPSNLTVMSQGIDARYLESYFPTQRFDAVIFNNPHIYNPPNTERLTLDLMQRYVSSAGNVVKPTGAVYITVAQMLLNKYPYIRDFLNTSTIKDRFIRSRYFAPFIPRYSTGDPFDWYGLDPERAGSLRGFQFTFNFGR